MGDSAGATLCLTTALQAARGRGRARGVPPPDGLVLLYPCLVAATSTLFASRMQALYDPMVPYGFLHAAISAYSPTAPGAGDYLLHPYDAPDELLRELPPTQLVVGGRDPVLDENVAFANRVKRHGRQPCELQVFPEVGHGFVSLAQYVPEASWAVRSTGDGLMRMIDQLRSGPANVAAAVAT